MWEYNFLELEADRTKADVETALNALGSEGWELVAAYRSNAGWNVFVCKRPIEAAERNRKRR
jgi:Domain of unknown function (DUF4177)